MFHHFPIFPFLQKLLRDFHTFGKPCMHAIRTRLCARFFTLRQIRLAPRRLHEKTLKANQYSTINIETSFIIIIIIIKVFIKQLKSVKYFWRYVKVCTEYIGQLKHVMNKEIIIFTKYRSFNFDCKVANCNSLQ